VVALALLFAVLPSSVNVLATDAVLVIRPARVGLTTIRTRALAPL
jgi:hypothetical protein